MHRFQPARNLAPERCRQRLLQPRARHYRRIAMTLRQRSKRVRQSQQIRFDQVRRLPPLQHQTGIDDVLAGGAPMHVARGVFIMLRDSGSQLLDQRDRQVACAGRGIAERFQVQRRLGAHCANRRNGFGRNHAKRAFGLGERSLHIEHRAHGGCIGPHRQHGWRGESAIEQSAGHGRIKRVRSPARCPAPHRCTSCTAHSVRPCVAADTSPSSPGAHRSCRAGGRVRWRRRSG